MRPDQAAGLRARAGVAGSPRARVRPRCFLYSTDEAVSAWHLGEALGGVLGGLVGRCRVLWAAPLEGRGYGDAVCLMWALEQGIGPPCPLATDVVVVVTLPLARSLARVCAGVRSLVQRRGEAPVWLLMSGEAPAAEARERYVALAQQVQRSAGGELRWLGLIRGTSGAPGAIASADLAWRLALLLSGPEAPNGGGWRPRLVPRARLCAGMTVGQSPRLRRHDGGA